MLGATSRRKRRTGGAARYAVPPGMRIVLHVGCGDKDPDKLHPRYRGAEWHELRLDINPGVRPDIVASMLDMDGVDPVSVNAVWSHHNIEHVFAHEVPLVLREFLRVLKPGGEVLLSTPDLQSVAEFIAAGRLTEAIYDSPAGGISALDVVYGHGRQIARGNEFMAHRTGFTARSLAQRFEQAGFAGVSVRRESDYSLWAEARRPGAAAG